MHLVRKSPCKINLLLNVLGKRADGFHELEMVMHPVGVCDELRLEQRPDPGVELSCSHPALPVDATNLVHRAATRFLQAINSGAGARIHLEKRIPLEAGLGGGSSNAANTLIGLNELFQHPLSASELFDIAAGIGSDVPFFLQPQPALVQGRGEQIHPHPFFPALTGLWLVLIHPGFGISTAWAYGALCRHPEALNGKPGRASDFIRLLEAGDVAAIGRALYNSLEAPCLKKYPILALYQDFLREHGALGALMSGSGSTTFALMESESVAQDVVAAFQKQFGAAGWIAVVPM